MNRWQILVTSFCLASAAQAQQGSGPRPVRAMVHPMLAQQELARQMLSRFTFGARPGDVEQVAAMGPDRWFARQLAPQTVDDKALDKRLQNYPTSTMTPEQALQIFPDRGNVQLVADGKRPYPADPLQAAVYQVQVYKLEVERAAKGKPELSDAEKELAKKADQLTALHVAGELFALPKNQRMSALLAISVQDRIAFANNIASPQRDILVGDFTPVEREAFYAMQGGVGAAGRIGDELAQAHVLRTVLSERQVQEVMTDFWFNHFNVFLPKDQDQWYTTSYERDIIRPHALGKFRDLLLATAESPAMMIYLDNWLSVGPDSIANGVNPANPKAERGTKGLNENYGRELMELHTLGVNGGYTQADVTHLSSMLTGWGVDRPGQGGGFQFDPKKHDPDTKEWFGYTIDEQGRIVARVAGKPAPPVFQFPPNTPEGMRQGLAALQILASAPQTAHFISFLLAQRFIADEPPPALVNRLTTVFLQSDGDIAVMLQALVASPEFSAPRYNRKKVRTPEEFLAAAFRVTATDPVNPGAMVNRLRDLGQPPYAKLEPTGYSSTADHWMNTASLVRRLNFADELTHNRFSNQKFDSSRVLAFGLMSERAPGDHPQSLPVSTDDAGAGPDLALHVLEATLIGGRISPSTDRFIRGQLAAQPASTPGETLNLITALLLGSPEFQLR